MRKRQVPDEVATFHFPTHVPGFIEVREFAWGRVLSGTWEDVPVLVVQEWWDTTARNTFYEYDYEEERAEDIARVGRFGRGDSRGRTTGAGVPAFVGPKSPILTARDAKPLPEPEPPEEHGGI